MLGVAFAGEVFGPGAAEQDDGSVLAILDDQRIRRWFKRLHIAHEPRAGFVRQHIDDGIDAVFILKPKLQDIELETPNRCDKEFQAIQTAHDLNRAFFRQLFNPFIKGFQFWEFAWACSVSTRLSAGKPAVLPSPCTAKPVPSIIKINLGL